MLVELLCLEVVGVESMALGMHFDSFGSLCAPVLGIIVSLGIDIELGKGGLDTALIIDG